jgi:hypothetical protein
MTYQSIENAFKNAFSESVKTEKARAKKEKAAGIYQADAEIFYQEKKKNMAAAFKFAAALKKELQNLHKIVPEFDFEIKRLSDCVAIRTNVRCDEGQSINRYTNRVSISANNRGFVTAHGDSYPSSGYSFNCNDDIVRLGVTEAGAAEIVGKFVARYAAAAKAKGLPFGIVY